MNDDERWSSTDRAWYAPRVETRNGEGIEGSVGSPGGRRRVATAAIVHALFAGQLVAGTALAAPSAADRETARGLLKQADARFEAKDYAAALKSYEAAHALVGVPSTGFAVAKTRAASGFLVEARDMAVEVSRMPASAGEPRAFVRAREAATALAEELEPRIPSLRISLSPEPPTGAAVHVSVDGNELPTGSLGAALKTNPGKHTVTATADGFEASSKDVTLAEGENGSVTVPLEPMATGVRPGREPPTAEPAQSKAGPLGDPARPTHLSPLVYVGFGVGAAGLLTGTVAGILHLTKTAAVKDDYCHGGTSCDPGFEGPQSSAKTFATVADIGFGVGVVGAAVGIVGLVISKPSAEISASNRSSVTPRFVPEIGLGQVRVRGSF